jgi:hypothetical protein
VAKKVILIVLGALGTLVGLALIAAATAIFVAFSPHGWIESGEHRVDTPTRALVSESAEFKDAADALNSFGDFRLRVRARALEPERPLFIGVGRTADVEAYVGTFRHDRVTSLDFVPFHLEKRPEGRDLVPAPPAAQPFWAQQVEGTGTQILDWKIRDGSYEVVLMYADAAPGVDARATFGVRVPFARGLAIACYAVGGIALMVGILLLVLGIRARPSPKREAPVWPEPGPGTEGQASPASSATSTPDPGG